MERHLPLIASCLATARTFAATDAFTVPLKNHAFEPKERKVPAGKKIKIRVVNLDPTPAEFESTPPNRKRSLPAHPPR